MSEWVKLWAAAFALTQVVEAPLYLLLSRRMPAFRRWCYALGASAITHPVLWFALPWESAGTSRNYWTLAIAGEAGVLAVEIVYGFLLRAPRPVLAACTANAASILAGILLQFLH
jgi:hypothetical protein